MPDVAGRSVGARTSPSPSAWERWTRILPRCANPRCATGWIHVWRRRRVPGFEGQWACSPECMEELVAQALRREMGANSRAPAAHQHRIPLGLLLVEQGQLRPEQLRSALNAWRRSGAGAEDGMRFGAWLVESGLINEPALTRGLSAQWNCPGYSLRNYRPEETAAVLPRFLADALGAVPVQVAARRVVHLAFSGTIDRSLSYAVERATGLGAATGIAGDAELQHARQRYLETAAPPVRFVEAAGPAMLVREIAARIDRVRPIEARLTRVHEVFWLRCWRRPEPAPGLSGCGDVEDLLCLLRPREGNSDWR